MTKGLSTQTRKSYVYLIVFYDGSFYYGVRLCPKGLSPWQDERYVGSPVTHKEKWKTTQFIKFILETFNDWDDARNKEIQYIKPNINHPKCLNENMGGAFSMECILNAQKVGVERARTPEIIKKKKEIYKKISHQQGEKNSQYGTMWITNGTKQGSFRIKKGEKIPEGFKKGRVCFK